MNRIAMNSLTPVQTLRAEEMAAVTGGNLLKKKIVLVHRFLPPWVRVTLNPQPLPPRLKQLIG